MFTYKVFIFIAMILLHILEDFHLQGILANMKQEALYRRLSVGIRRIFSSAEASKVEVIFICPKYV